MHNTTEGCGLSKGLGGLNHVYGSNDLHIWQTMHVKGVIRCDVSYKYVADFKVVYPYI